MGIYGQDWASYQGSVPSTAGLSFVFVKVTEGEGYVNPAWLSQRADAKGAGLVFGAYHYPHMHDDAHAEADFFLSKITLQPGDLVVLDWEGYDAANQGVSKADQLAYKESYLAYMKSKLPHNPVGLYCNTDYWRNVDTTGHRGDFLWIATAGLPAGQPGISAPWLFHQYGAAGVDRDFCNLNSLADLRAWALSFAQPSEADVNLSDRMPAYAGIKQADGSTYIPTVGECLNGAKTADAQLTALDAKVTAIATALSADKAELDQIKAGVAQVFASLQALATAGSVTAAQVQAGVQAELVKLGQLLGGMK